MISPSRATEWFTPMNDRPGYGGETGSEPPPPCRHQLATESLRDWLCRQPADALVPVDEILMRLGRSA